MITKDKHKAREFINNLPDDTLIEVKPFKKTRSGQQNRALHLFFGILASKMRELGMTYNDSDILGNSIETPWTQNLVKYQIWVKIQMAMFGFESTTKLTTSNIDEILDVLAIHFREQGIPIHFPNQFDAYLNIEQ